MFLKKMQKKNKLAYLDFFLIFLSLVAAFFLRQDLVLIILFVFTLFYLYMTQRTGLLKTLLLSFILSFLLVFIARNYFIYKSEFLTIQGISLFPLLAWTLGLFGLYLMHKSLEKHIKNPTLLKKLLLLIVIYWPLLISVETLWYHKAGVQLNSHYSGLPVCDCIHAVWWAKIAYFLIGIIFFIINYYLVEKQLNK